jgi:hypothetical protein
MQAPRPLPCFPCPHGSACCNYGTTLSESEAAVIGRDYGQHLIYRLRSGEGRTRVRRGKCVFLEDNACRLHDAEHYPAVCRGFPWTDAETGGPYQFDQTICPELRSGE